MLAILGVGFLLPLIAFATVGAFSRYAADDYCTAGILRTEGFLGAQRYWYTTFSPRYAFTFLVSLAELGGPGMATILPAAAIVVWLLALVWTLGELSNSVPWLASLLVRFVLAEVVTFATLSTTPDIGQSLFWQTGLLTYLLPLILLTLFGGWILRSVRTGTSWWLLAGGVALTFFAGGLSETYLAVQGGALGLALLACLVSYRSEPAARAIPLLVAGLIGTMLAVVAELVSPSVVGRQESLQPPLVLAIEAAVRIGFLWAVRWAWYALPILAACVATAWVTYRVSRDSGPNSAASTRHVLITGGLVLLLVPAAFLPAFYSLGGDPPARALIVPTYALIAFVVYAAIRLAPRFQPPVAPLAVAVVAVLVPLAGALQTLPRVASAAAYADQWDAVDQHIRTVRSQGARSVIVPPLPRNLGERYVATDPTDWFNICVARYYGLDSIAAGE